MATNTLSYNPNAGIGQPSMSGGLAVPPFDFNRPSVYDDPINDQSAMLADIEKRSMDILNESQQVAQQSMRQVQSSINLMSATLMTGLDNNMIDVEAEVGKFRLDVEQAIGNIALAATKQSEYYSLQVESAARTGRLGANQAAVLREASRATGNILAQTMGAIGEMQLKAAAQATDFALRGKESNQKLWSATMGQMVQLVGLSAQASMEFAGIVGKNAQAQVQTLTNIAGLSTDMAKVEMELAHDWNKTMAQIEASQDATTSKTGSQMSALMLEMGWKSDEAEKERQFKILQDDLQAEREAAASAAYSEEARQMQASLQAAEDARQAAEGN